MAGNPSSDVQAFAYLRRLGYTVQRVRPFIPQHFVAGQNETTKSGRITFPSSLSEISSSLINVMEILIGMASYPLRVIVSNVGLTLFSSIRDKSLQIWGVPTYCE